MGFYHFRVSGDADGKNWENVKGSFTYYIITKGEGGGFGMISDY